MIYTVTFNPSTDYLVNVEDFQLGVDELSVSPGKILSLRKAVRETTVE